VQHYLVLCFVGKPQYALVNKIFELYIIPLFYIMPCERRPRCYSDDYDSCSSGYSSDGCKNTRHIAVEKRQNEKCRKCESCVKHCKCKKPCKKCEKLKSKKSEIKSQSENDKCERDGQKNGQRDGQCIVIKIN